MDLGMKPTKIQMDTATYVDNTKPFLPLALHNVAIDCGPPLPPTFGRVKFTSTTINSVAKYCCQKGYGLVGTKHRVCLINGRWSGRRPMCLQILSEL